MSEGLADERALVPVEQRTIDFYEDEILAALIEVDGRPEVFIPIRPICEYLGLAWNGQFERLKRDPVLSEAIRSVRVTRTERGEREVLALPVDYLNGWLFGVNPTRVKPELRDKVIRYQRECYRALARAFQMDSLAAKSAPPPNSTLVQVREMVLAIVALAEQQMALEARQATSEARLDRAAEVVNNLQRRLTTVENRLSPAAAITDEQAAEVASRVKALATELTQRQPGKNHYQGVFAEMYRRFGVSSYKLIRQDDYPVVLNFLEEWRLSGRPD